MFKSAPPNLQARFREGNRELVVQAARKVLLRDGAAQFSLRAVARELGCVPGALYTYFDGKDALMAAVVDASFGRLGHLLRAAKSSGGIADRMRHAGKIYVEFGLKHSEDYVIAFMLPSAGLKPGYKPHDAYLWIRSAIAQAVAKGELRGDPDEIVQVMWTNLHGLVSLLIQRPHFPWVPRKRLIDAVLDQVAAGVLARQRG